MECPNCGKQLADNALFCPECGYNFSISREKIEGVNKSWLIALLLCLFLGTIGAHRFYLNKKGSGLAMLLLTLTVFGAFISVIWSFVDLIVILCGNFKTGDGRILTK